MQQKTGLFDSAADGFNSGVMLIDMAMPRRRRHPRGASRGLQARRAFSQEALSFDQDMLNLIFRDNWKKLRLALQRHRPAGGALQAMDCFVLHYTGRRGRGCSTPMSRTGARTAT